MIKKFKIIIYVCIAVIVSNIAVKFLIIDELNNKITLLQKRAVRSKIVRPGKSSSVVSVEKDYIKKIIQKIPDEFSFTQYAVRIRELIDKNHLSIKGSLIFKPEQIKKMNLLKYNTSLVVTGNYNKIKTLISDLQMLPGLSYINSVSIGRESDDPDKIKLNLGLSMFFTKGTT